jgi:hypothetical protein
MKRVLSMIVCTLCLAVGTTFSQLHENIGPDNEDKTIITKAPSGQYSLVQTQANPPLKSCEDGPCYQTTIVFRISPSQIGSYRRWAYPSMWFIRQAQIT